jgi:creatinine amidohydrolase
MTDAAWAIDVAEGAAERAKVLIAPPLWFGWAPHHLAYPGTISLRPDTLMAVVEDTCYSLVYHGFKRLIIINGHRVANLPPLEIAITRVRNKTGAYVAVIDVALIALKEVERIIDSEVGSIWHAAAAETSFMLYKHGDLVEMSQAVRRMPTLDKRFLHSPISMESRLDWNRGLTKSTIEEFKAATQPTGITGDPLVASAEKGQRIYEAIVNNTVEFIEQVKKIDVQLKGVEPPI